MAAVAGQREVAVPEPDAARADQAGRDTGACGGSDALSGMHLFFSNRRLARRFVYS